MAARGGQRRKECNVTVKVRVEQRVVMKECNSVAKIVKRRYRPLQLAKNTMILHEMTAADRMWLGKINPMTRLSSWAMLCCCDHPHHEFRPKKRQNISELCNVD